MICNLSTENETCTYLIIDYSFKQFINEKCTVFAGYSVSSVTICCFSLLRIIVKLIYLGFRLFVTQNKLFEDIQPCENSIGQNTIKAATKYYFHH